jgi:DNA-binding transcriptional LysR family regulator
MADLDLNLLAALDVLLAEGSVTGAAQRMDLSTSAMSRTLTRLREATGDPLLVRAGRGLVPTPHAIALRDQVRQLTRDARTVLSPQVNGLDVESLEKSFTLRTSEGFLERFLVPLIAAVRDAAPRVRLRFAPKPDKDTQPLREGPVDLDIGVLTLSGPGAAGPEIRTRFLFRDTVVGAVRPDHPLLCEAITAERYAACEHVVASRRGATSGPVDDALAEIGLERRIAAIVPGFPDALHLAQGSDLVALVPRSCLSGNPLVSFDLPVPTPEVVVSAMWHPRLDGVRK